MKTILARLGRYKKASIFTPLFATLEVIMEVLLPFIAARIIDEGLETGNMQRVYQYGLLMILLAFLSLMFGTMAGKYAASASSGLACNLRESIYDKIQTFSFSNIDKYSTAGLVTRMTTDVTNIQNAYQMILRIAVRSPMMLICSMAMCFLINRKLSLIFLGAICFLALVLGGIMKKTMKTFDLAFHKYDDLNAGVQENVSAIRVVKSYVREDYEKQKFSGAAGRLYQLFTKAEGLLAFNNPAMMLVVYGCIIAVSYMGARYIVGGMMSTGDITSLLSYIMSIMMSLMMLSMVFVMITMSSASIRRIAQVLNEVPDMRSPEEPKTVLADSSIDFNNVSFTYHKGSKPALKDITLHIRSGETIGIIGGTGSGKTSLVNLISRLYDVQQGTVCAGGLDVRDYDLNALRHQIAVVLQKNVLFSGTILENLRWGSEEASEQDCRKACQAACADEFIEQLPEKYETYIERGGTNVSGGQKQRLCIARALLKQPKILILDDSTSAVDTATDAKIRQALREQPGTTKLIIAQRISSVQEADRILVLDDGRVNGFDNHENLLRTNDIYREIYESQSKGGGDFDQPAGKESA
ncbi:ABC transporter ATP-binding protein [Anaerolentibacter hominis]|uniref:ABC transporter ATP-binding protein n=1 Tax=Anaerolentibacter hominis TaxID=3079009 RepID=UPI0031B7FA7C